MSDDPPPFSKRLLLWYERMLLAMLAVLLLTLLVIASGLTPSAQGMGTHQQMGLPPCTFATQFGMRCPSCGMTTSWSHLMNGNLFGSVQVNSAGCLLGILAVISGPWALVSAIRGTWACGPPSERLLITLTIVVVLVTIVDWLFRIL
ncbi:MAG: DUF2752 domain-containing protein [Pirellulales bacterium]